MTLEEIFQTAPEQRFQWLKFLVGDELRSRIKELKQVDHFKNCETIDVSDDYEEARNTGWDIALNDQVEFNNSITLYVIGETWSGVHDAVVTKDSIKRYADRYL